MVDNGYFIEEPLILLRTEGGKLIVVEGNRRLAALKLLNDEELRRISFYRKEWDELVKINKQNLKEVPCIIREDISEIYRVLGFRHISGIKKWQPLPKARFIDMLVTSQKKNAGFDDIAEKCGTSSKSIRDYYIAYRLYLQAKEDFDIDVSEVENNFSVFLRALNSKEINQFIGLKKNKSPVELKKPILTRKSPELNEFIEMLLGTKEKEPVINDSRQITKLGIVLVNPAAYKHLKISSNLEQAYYLTGNIKLDLIEHIEKTDYHLGEILKDIHEYSTNQDIYKLLDKCNKRMSEIMKHFILKT